ncbi:MAG TPA: hypothetical protein VFV64_10545 [Permianibacter sp.]|nr:hypothetical protein [Permianibacter sp.]
MTPAARVAFMLVCSSLLLSVPAGAWEQAPVQDQAREQASQRETATRTCTASQQALLSAIAQWPEAQWRMVSENRFDSVWTPPALRPLNRGQATPPSRLITAWGGFAWDSTRSALWLFGGGHADYSGNEVYVWHGADRRWQRASLPSEITGDNTRIETAIDGVDNAPAAAHSYDNNVYLPRLDRLLSFGGAAYNNGGAWRRPLPGGGSVRTGPYLFDVSRADAWTVGGSDGSHVQRQPEPREIRGGRLWHNRDSYLDPAAGTVTPTQHVSGCTAYADEDGIDTVYAVAILGGGTAQHLFRYRVRDLTQAKADSWDHVGQHWNGPASETACGYDPFGKWLVRTGSHGKPFMVWSLHQPGPNNRDQVIVPADPAQQFLPLLKARQLDLSRCGLDFDLRRRQFWLWCGGASLWQLSPPTDAAGWRIAKAEVIAAPAPKPEVGNGVLGKWAYATELDVLVALQDGNAGNVWFFKPPHWQPGCAPADGEKRTQDSS